MPREDMPEGQTLGHGSAGQERVVLLNASGCLDALTGPDTARQLDAFVTKTITPLPRAGNEPIRIAETDYGMLNAIGLANPGREWFLARVLPQLRELGVSLWVSVGGFAAAEYAETCSMLEDIAAIELNLSCPNVDEAPESAAEIVAACRAATDLPLFAKLSPAAWDIAEVARAVESAGADGLSLVNTIRGLVLDPKTLRPKLARGSGGYSGPALKPIALAAVYACYQATSLPIVGIGGVANGDDALDLIACGASAVAVGTTLFADPDAPSRIRKELAAAASERGFPSSEAARGAAHQIVAISDNGRDVPVQKSLETSQNVDA
jgi:dihydroorotate dehydrogenase (NAD+) catalytic subunit